MTCPPLAKHPHYLRSHIRNKYLFNLSISIISIKDPVIIFNTDTALRAAMISTSVSYILLLAAQKMKLCNIDPVTLAGSAVTKRKDSGSSMLGFLLFLASGAVLGTIYALILSLWGAPLWWRGLVLSLPHAAITFSTAALFCRLPSLRARVLPSPPPDFHCPSYTLLVIFFLHGIFGISMGLFYRI